MEKIITVIINKPLYNNFVYINSEKIDLAIKRGAKLEIIIPKGRAIVDPKEWKAKGNIMKKVFKRPDDPMVLYGGNVPIGENSNKLF